MVDNFSFSPLIFIGDTHGFLDDFAKQKEVIEKVKPEYILTEQLQNNVLDSPKAFKRFKETKLKEFSEITKLIYFCEENNIKLIGIDLKHFGLNKRLRDLIKKGLEPSKKDEEEINKILSKRNKLHIKNINYYARNTNRPLVIILGSWHLRKDSPIINSFNQLEIIYPRDNSGKLVMQPIEGKVSYGKYIKN